MSFPGWQNMGAGKGGGRRAEEELNRGGSQRRAEGRDKRTEVRGREMGRCAMPGYELTGTVNEEEPPF